MTGVRPYLVLKQDIPVSADADARLLFRFDVHGCGHRFLEVVVADVVGTHPISYDQVITEFELANVLALQPQSQRVDGHVGIKCAGTVNRGKKQSAVVVYVIPVIDRGMHLSDDDREPLAVLIFEPGALYAHPEVSTAMMVVSNRSDNGFTEKRACRGTEPNQ